MHSSTRRRPGSALLAQIVAQGSPFVSAFADEREHDEERVRRHVSLDAVDLAVPRRFAAEIVAVGEELDGRGAANTVSRGKLALAQPRAVEIGDDAGAVEIELQ